MQGNLSVLTYPDGKELEYSYDKNGNVILVTDWENRETSFSYDKNGRLVRTERADGSTESSNRQIGQYKVPVCLFCIWRAAEGKLRRSPFPVQWAIWCAE